MSRVTLLDMKWHKASPGVENCMWGFNNSEETMVMVECLFPDVETTEIPTIQPNTQRMKNAPHRVDDLKVVPHMSKIKEKCPVCRLSFYCNLNYEFIGLILHRHRTTI